MEALGTSAKEYPLCGLILDCVKELRDNIANEEQDDQGKLLADFKIGGGRRCPILSCKLDFFMLGHRCYFFWRCLEWENVQVCLWEGFFLTQIKSILC